MMLRIFLVVVFLVVSVSVQAQMREPLRGLLLDAISERPVSAAHVINYSDSLATISSMEGLFRVPVKAGDSVMISCIGYASRAFVVDLAMLFAEVVVIRMSPRQYQLAEVEVNPFGTKAQFQKRFMELEVDDGTIDIVGIQKPARPPREIPITEDANEIKKAKYLMNPASFIYGNLSKDAKSRQELHRLEAEQRKFAANERKYNEKMVAGITGYEGEKVRDFMDFCNFSEAEIHGMIEYQLTMAILGKQRQFDSAGGRSNR